MTERRGWVGGESKGQTRMEIYSVERRGHAVKVIVEVGVNNS